MPRLKFTIAYVGTNYCGFQIQENAPTIQAELEKVLKTVMGYAVRVHGAGRTDSGVHADAQVVHADIPEDKINLDWQRIFNTNLPSDINIYRVERVADDFHSRFDSISKTYGYTFWTNRCYMPPRLRPFAWDCGQLNIAAMQEALPYLQGSHDFACFQNAGTPIEDTVRNIHFISLERNCAFFHEDHMEHIVHLKINANGFLKQMVRNIAGLLVAVGRGNMQCTEIPQLISSANRKNSPPTAPACGLNLLNVHYSSENI